MGADLALLGRALSEGRDRPLERRAPLSGVVAMKNEAPNPQPNAKTVTSTAIKTSTNG
jgi:hypothetical protein